MADFRKWEKEEEDARKAKKREEGRAKRASALGIKLEKKEENKQTVEESFLEEQDRINQIRKDEKSSPKKLITLHMERKQKEKEKEELKIKIREDKKHQEKYEEIEDDIDDDKDFVSQILGSKEVKRLKGSNVK